MGASPWQLAIVVVIALLLFGGRGRISSIMGDFAKGIKSFRKGMEDEEANIALQKDKEQEEASTLKAEEVKTEETTKASS